MAIEKLEISGFRGATQPVEISFAPNCMIVIYGENGTGKSTIIDALDFVCNGQYGSLSERAGTQPKTHLPAQGVERTELRVHLHGDGRMWIRTLTPTGPSVVGPPDPPMAMILRRSQVLQVVNSMPADRYKAIRSYIDLPGIVKSETSLRAATTEAGHVFAGAVQAKEQADETLRSLWVKAGQPGASQEAWAAQQAQADPDALLLRVQSYQDTLVHLDVAEQAWRQSEQARNILAFHTQAVAEAQATLAAGHQKRDEADPDLLDALSRLHMILQGRPAPDACPVCGSSAEALGLTDRLGQRLAALQHLRGLRTSADKAETERQQAEFIHQHSWASYLSAVLALPPAATGILTEADAAQRLAQARAVRVEMEERLAQTQQDLSRIGLIQTLLHDWQEKTALAEQSERATRQLKSLLAVVETARKEYVDGLLRAISNDVARMYVKMHPDEDVGDVRFYLDSRYPGSLTFDGRFGAQTGIPPQAYYSESHLDTLGICVFLALAQSQYSRARMVVLDDVLTSVDSSHLTRFLEMLEEEKFSQQLIITTHHRKWLNRYKRLTSAKVQVIELQRWNLEWGIRPTKVKFIVDDLREKIEDDPLDRQAVASTAGVLLESVLDQLAIKYGCSMPRNVSNNYTLQPLCDGVTKLARTLKVSRPARGEQINLSPLLDHVKRLVHVRNQVGAHANPEEVDVPDSEVRDFVRAAVALASALICPDCSLMPYKNMGTALHCGCGMTHFIPPPSPNA